MVAVNHVLKDLPVKVETCGSYCFVRLGRKKGRFIGYCEIPKALKAKVRNPEYLNP